MGFKLDPREIGWAPYVMIGGGFGVGARECRDFRVRAAIVDPKEVPDGPTQDPSHT
jgi:hypothetical protein